MEIPLFSKLLPLAWHQISFLNKILHLHCNASSVGWLTCLKKKKEEEAKQDWNVFCNHGYKGSIYLQNEDKVKINTLWE